MAVTEFKRAMYNSKLITVFFCGKNTIPIYCMTGKCLIMHIKRTSIQYTHNAVQDQIAHPPGSTRDFFVWLS